MNMRMIYRFFLPFLLLFALSSQTAAAQVWLIDVEGAIGPATADHVIRGMEDAQAAAAELILLRIDTPGGLDTSMRAMIKSILATSIPVIGYVSPSGARAASAGTYLLYATHIAAMSPGTNLGAATPVQIGSPGLGKFPGTGDEDETPPQAGTAMEKKIINDAVAYIQSLAQLRGRNSEWAEKAVRQGASLSAEDALKAGVIDIMAVSAEDLLQQIHGFELQINDETLTLQTSELSIYHHPVDWRSQFLAVITDPNIAYVLMLVGIYGLIIEFYNPGFGLPGVLGAVSLLVALYAFQVLPISYAGLGLILLGIGLMTAEAFAPSFGILGLGGVVAFVIGSVMLMDTDLPAYQLALPMILAFAAFSAALLILALRMVLKVRRRESVSGAAHLVGEQAIVEIIGGGDTFVRLDGELWHVRSDCDLELEDKVTVDAIDGLILQVSKNNGGS